MLPRWLPVRFTPRSKLTRASHRTVGYGAENSDSSVQLMIAAQFPQIERAQRMSIKPRILLAGNQALVVEVFAKVLQRYFDLAAAVSDRSELLRLAQQLNPDVVVLDLEIALSDGQNTSERLKRLLPDTKQIVLAMDENCEIPAFSLRSASGFLMQSCGQIELVRAIKKVLKGKCYVTARMAQRMSDGLNLDLSPGHAKHLTPRQSQVLQLLAEGRTMKEAATALGVTARTIAFHKYRIMDQFDLKTNSDLVRFAIKKGLLAGS